MTHELAKQLKDAGFPQRQSLDKQIEKEHQCQKAKQ